VGIEAKFTVDITKTCDGCGVSYEATGKFASAAAAVAFGGPIEAASWQVRTTPEGAHLLCDLCVEHQGHQ
jgi:hypothetical protein